MPEAARSIGLFVAWWSTRAIASFLAGSWAIDRGPTIDWRVLGFGAVVTAVVTLLFGAAPALLVARSAPAEVLKTHDRRVGGSSFRTSGFFVTAQVALSMVLVVVTGLFVGTFGRLARLPLGFLGDRILVVDVQANRAMPAAERIDFSQRLVQAAASTPGVAAAAGSRLTPLSTREQLDVGGAEEHRPGERRHAGMVRDVRNTRSVPDATSTAATSRARSPSRS